MTKETPRMSDDARKPEDVSDFLDLALRRMRLFYLGAAAQLIADLGVESAQKGIFWLAAIFCAGAIYFIWRGIDIAERET